MPQNCPTKPRPPQSNNSSPRKSYIPTVSIAPAKGWPDGGKPQAAAGLAVNAFAKGLEHPRWMFVLPNGDILVAESDGPKRPKDGNGAKGWIYKAVQKWAGSNTQSADRITLLRDKDHDGVAETRSVFLQNLHSPFGMALIGDDLYVANADAIVRFKYQEDATAITTSGEKWSTSLAARSITTGPRISLPAKMARNFMRLSDLTATQPKTFDAEKMRADILEVDLKSRQVRVFASGLRNPVGMGWEPQTGCSGRWSMSAMSSAVIWCQTISRR
jgi:glucose/arabinose dehydrogenase